MQNRHTIDDRLLILGDAVARDYTAGPSSKPPRYYVKDALHGQSLDLISTGDRRRRERWLIIDSETNRDVDVFASKKAATDTARDMNAAAAQVRS